MRYGVEVLGWKEWVEVEKIQTKYIKWCLGIDRWTPNYIVKNRIHSNTIKWAARFEGKSETEDKKPLLNKCVEEMTKSQTETEWRRQRMKSIDEYSLSQEGLEMLRRREVKVSDKLKEKWDEIDRQILYVKI